MPPRKLTGKGARHRRAARPVKPMECPHGENCACAISSRHAWFRAFVAEREQVTRIIVMSKAMQAGLERQLADMCKSHEEVFLHADRLKRELQALQRRNMNRLIRRNHKQ